MKREPVQNFQFSFVKIDEHVGMLVEDRRVLRESIPEKLYMYEIRHTDDDWGEPCQLSDHIFVNFFGTFITDHEIPCDKDGYFDFDPKAYTYPSLEEIVNFAGGSVMSDLIVVEITGFFLSNAQREELKSVEENQEKPNEDL